jgi:hypothetical protein
LWFARMAVRRSSPHCMRQAQKRLTAHQRRRSPPSDPAIPFPTTNFPGPEFCVSISALYNNGRETKFMVSKKQIEANRKNSKKSTGPRPPEGRLASSLNAVRHGLTAVQLVVSVEEEAEFQEILQDFQAELKPTGTLEQALFDQVVAAHWRMRRLREIKTGYFELRLTEHADPLEDDFPDLQGAAKLALTVQHDSTGYYVLVNLSRYEARIERSFYRALRELQRLQAARASQPISPSAANADPPAAPPNSVLPKRTHFRTSSHFGSSSSPRFGWCESWERLNPPA